MVNARLHVICGNCGCNDMFEAESVIDDDRHEVYLSCRNCTTLHILSRNAKMKDSCGAEKRIRGLKEELYDAYVLIDSEFLGVKPIAQVLSAREVEFVKAVCAFTGSKHPTSHYLCEHQEDESQDGEDWCVWSRPQDLGLIEAVGSYKWKPGKKLKILYMIEDDEV